MIIVFFCGLVTPANLAAFLFLQNNFTRFRLWFYTAETAWDKDFSRLIDSGIQNNCQKRNRTGNYP